MLVNTNDKGKKRENPSVLGKRNKLIQRNNRFDKNPNAGMAVTAPFPRKEPGFWVDLSYCREKFHGPWP